MKKLVFAAFVFSALYFNAQQQKNTFLDANFWKSNPDLTTIKAEISKGNNASESNASAFDVVTVAINNNASTEVIKYLIEQPGNSISKITHDGRIYLHWAANRGNAEVVKYLIQKGSNINLEDSKGYTPIVFAAMNGVSNPEIFNAFFSAGLDPKKKYTDGANLLLLSIPNDKDFKATDFFITKGLSLKDVDANGATAFDYAAKSGNIEVLKSLLSKGVKATDNALLMAALGSRREGNTLDVYQYLVNDLKLKPSVTSKEGAHVLHLISSKPNQAEIAKFFIDKGVDANKADAEGNTALLVAAKGKDLALVELLLSKTKNINALNEKGESALSNAIAFGSPEMATFLLKNKADIKTKDIKGNNLAYYLIQSYRAPRPGAPAEQKDEFAEKLHILQSNGLDVVSPQTDGNTLYHLAIAKNDIKLLEKISDLGININAINKEGMTVLHKAALVAKDDVILKYLLSKGAKKDIKTEFDETAYDFAKDNEYLSKNKIDINFLK